MEYARIIVPSTLVPKGREFWFRDVDSNHDTQLQRLMSYRLDDPGTGPNSVADARKRAHAAQSTDSRPLNLRAVPRRPVLVIKFPEQH